MQSCLIRDEWTPVIKADRICYHYGFGGEETGSFRTKGLYGHIGGGGRTTELTLSLSRRQNSGTPLCVHLLLGCEIPVVLFFYLSLLST